MFRLICLRRAVKIFGKCMFEQHINEWRHCLDGKRTKTPRCNRLIKCIFPLKKYRKNEIYRTLNIFATREMRDEKNSNQIDRNVEGIHYINIARRRLCVDFFLPFYFVRIRLRIQHASICVCVCARACEFLTVTYDVCEIHWRLKTCNSINERQRGERKKCAISCRRCETNSLGQMKQKTKSGIDIYSVYISQAQSTATQPRGTQGRPVASGDDTNRDIYTQKNASRSLLELRCHCARRRYWCNDTLCVRAPRSQWQWIFTNDRIESTPRNEREKWRSDTMLRNGNKTRT